MKLGSPIAGAALSLAAGAAPAGLSGDGVLVHRSGMTLYIFDNDRPGVSNCTGGCAAS